jgi:tetratricopeptide (TPR) repeat protein/signal transduction histidine kinase
MKLLVYYKIFGPVRLMLLFCLCITFCVTRADARVSSHYIDSLTQRVDEAEGAAKYDALITLVRKLAENDYAQALRVAEEAYAFAKEYGDSSRIVESGRICGQLFNRLDQNNEAINILQEILPVAERHNFKTDYKTILDNLAIAYTIRAEYEKALHINLKVLVLKEQEKDSLETSFTLNNIGLVYYKMSNFEEALAHYLKSLKMRERLKDRYDLDMLLINIGLCYNQLERFEQAREYFMRAFNECGSNCQDKIVAEGNYGLGLSYLELKDYKQARHHLEIAYKAASKNNIKRFAAESLFSLARLDIAEGKLSEAEESLKNVEEISAQERYNQLLISTYQKYADLYELKKDYVKSTYYLKKYVALKDDIYNEQLIGKLTRLKTDYEQRENLATIRAKESTIEQQRQVNIYITITALLSGLLILVLQNTNRVTRQVNAQLSEAQNIILEQNKLLHLKNKDLDQKVEKKTEELKLVNLSLKEMNDEVDNFIQKTSQDIRGPLASLKGICNVALMDVKDKTAQLYLNKINATTELLNSILGRLLVINRITNSRPSFTKINFRDVIEDIVVEHQRKGLPHNLVIRKNIGENSTLYSDKELLKMVLENSIDHVVRLSKDSPQNEFFVEINVEPVKNGRVGIRVIDNGRAAGDAIRRDFGMFLDVDRYEKENRDLYFVKTAATKIGGKVDMQKTQEGFNELRLILAPEPVREQTHTAVLPFVLEN